MRACVFYSDLSYLRRAGKAVYDAMLAADPKAIWLAVSVLPASYRVLGLNFCMYAFGHKKVKI